MLTTAASCAVCSCKSLLRPLERGGTLRARLYCSGLVTDGWSQAQEPWFWALEETHCWVLGSC